MLKPRQKPVAATPDRGLQDPSAVTFLASLEVVPLAKPNYSFEKKQREIAKKKQQDEKDARKREAREAARAAAEPAAPAAADEK